MPALCNSAARHPLRHSHRYHSFISLHPHKIHVIIVSCPCTQIKYSVGHDELVESIQSLGSKEAAPEVTVVLVAPPSLHASRPASLPALQAAVQGAPSSRIVPCLTR